jgi:hypothetical protein
MTFAEVDLVKFQRAINEKLEGLWMELRGSVLVKVNIRAGQRASEESISVSW